MLAQQFRPAEATGFGNPDQIAGTRNRNPWYNFTTRPEVSRTQGFVDLECSVAAEDDQRVVT